MLRANIGFCNIGFIAKREFIYRHNFTNRNAKKYRLTEAEKEKIKNFEIDPLDDFATWHFLLKVWDAHADAGEKAESAYIKSIKIDIF